MLLPVMVRVFDRNRLVYSEDFQGPVQLGRQTEGEEPLRSLKLDNGTWRAVIAALDEDTVSRKHALVEPLPDGGVRLTNLSSRARIRLADGGELGPNSSQDFPTPLVMVLGRKTVRIQHDDGDGLELHGLAEMTARPGAPSTAASRLPALKLPAVDEVQIDSIIRWLQVTMGVLQSAASSSDFFQKAARAVVDIVGLDSGRVLVLDNQQWKTEAYETASSSPDERDWRPSRQVLAQMCQERRTFWQVTSQSTLEAASLVGIKAVVAAPILDRKGEVIAALYGDRRQGGLAQTSPQITRLEAMLVELLASSVAAGLARIEQERAALASRVQFEQFFTTELARQLAAEPDLLKGRDSEVTILFCDIRGFSRFSERLGPARTVDWIADVMGTLSDCVLAHSGVLVDYIGDEVMAMWGAPQKQPDHARLACKAALDMLGKLPELTARWQETLNGALGLGIGINTGIARVGNTGSRHKFKYGPLGNTVNLASRLQGATKYLKARLVIAGATQAQLGTGFLTRRLGKIRVVNIAEPVDLYEVATESEPNWPALHQGYEQALALFEKREFRQASRILGNLVIECPSDGPSLVLLSRVVNALVEDAAEFDPVWELPGK